MLRVSVSNPQPPPTTTTTTPNRRTHTAHFPITNTRRFVVRTTQHRLPSCRRRHTDDTASTQQRGFRRASERTCRIAHVREFPLSACRPKPVRSGKLHVGKSSFVGPRVASSDARLPLSSAPTFEHSEQFAFDFGPVRLCDCADTVRSKSSVRDLREYRVHNFANSTSHSASACLSRFPTRSDSENTTHVRWRRARGQ